MALRGWQAYGRAMKRFITLLISGGIAWWAWWYTFSVDPGGEGFGFEPCADGEGTCSDDPSVFFLILAIVAGIVAFFSLLSFFSLIRRKLKGEDTSKPMKAKNQGFTWVDPSTTVSAWTQQVSATMQQGIAAAQQAQAQVQYPAGFVPSANPAAGNPAAGNPTMVGQAGIIGAPAGRNPAMGNPAAHNAAAPNVAGPSAAAPNAAVAAAGAASAAAGAAQAAAGHARVPTAADRAASKDKWLRRASSGDSGGGNATSLAETALPSTLNSSLTGVPAYAPPSSSGGVVSAAASNPATASLVLTAIGPRELGVQREVRRLTGFGLAEAKQLMATVPSTPQFIAVDLPWDEVQAARRTLEKMGASVEVR